MQEPPSHPPQQPHKYQPCYCEENIWHLCQEPQFSNTHTFVALISNLQKTCALWHQRASSNPQEPVIWDYHVILLASPQHPQSWSVWDLDTRLPSPLPFAQYIDQTFWGTPFVPPQFAPIFRLLPAQEYVQTLSTDRSHMLDPQGAYIKPPPSWPPPFHPHLNMNLHLWSDLQRPSPGQLLSLHQMRLRFSPPHTA